LLSRAHKELATASLALTAVNDELSDNNERLMEKGTGAQIAESPFRRRAQSHVAGSLHVR
jgi:hypothetical protein